MIPQAESIWWMARCDFCWREIKSTEAVHVGEKTYCSQDCRLKDEANPEGAEA